MGISIDIHEPYEELIPESMQEPPEYHEIIPEFNASGRLCNYHTGEGATIRVMRGEWERFNKLAGRQHEIIDGTAVFNKDLEPCMPDAEEATDANAEIIKIYEYLTDLDFRLLMNEWGL